jgi:NNP family nitrate/nitrite transporter-like MFS transporter
MMGTTSNGMGADEADYSARREALEQEKEGLAEEWELCKTDPYRASPGSNFKRYDVTVDYHEGDRATEIKLCSFKRPHMRGLHCAWISFFCAFLVWFAPAPLLSEIRDNLGLSKADVWNSSIANDIVAVMGRILIGPICDNYGARIPMAMVLVVSSIPTAMVGFVNTSAGLSIIRLFIGIAGSSFVMAQFWPSRLFSREISGTANGLVGGWGNLGGACTQLLMGTILFPIFEDYYDGDSAEALKVVFFIPAAIAFTWGLILPFISDDAPMGNYGEMKKNGSMDRIYFTTSLRSGATINTWVLYAQYAASFGVELVMNNAAVLYFTDEFGLSTKEASTLGFVYGSMNIFARVSGGWISDRLNMRIGMRGRLWLVTILLILEGAMILVFAFAESLAGAVVTMCIFSIFTQAAEGAIYGVVPYVSKLHTGAVAGLVGSGGNMGSIIYGRTCIVYPGVACFIALSIRASHYNCHPFYFYSSVGFRSLSYRNAFVMMGCMVVASSFLSIFINIPLHAGLLRGEDNHTVIEARKRFLLRREFEQQVKDYSRDPGAGAVIPVDMSEALGPSEVNTGSVELDHTLNHTEHTLNHTENPSESPDIISGGEVVDVEDGAANADATKQTPD